MPTPTRVDPYLAGNFRVEIDGIGALSFSEVSGLDVSIEVIDYREGNEPGNGVRKLAGLSKCPDITLKRGVIGDLSLWNWINRALTGNVQRTTVAITLLDAADNPIWTWTLKNAWPCRWTGPSLVASSSEIAIESLEICHEGLALVAQS